MPDSLLHVPEGDHNPYDAVPWSRQPLEPLADEPFRVGVRGTGHDGVVVEWRSASDTGEAPLTLEGDTWIGHIGPFGDDGRYRFVGSRGAIGESRTEWFKVPITRWQPIFFRGVLPDADRILVVGDGALLTLAPTADGALDWQLETTLLRHDGSPSTQHQGWSVRVADDGDVVVTCGSTRLNLRAARAQTGSATTAWRLGWALDPAERLLGTGERHDHVDQRGRSPDVRVFEQYKQQGSRTYFPAPWLVSTRGYGLAIHGAARVRYDLGQTVANEASVTVPTTSVASGRWYLGAPEEVLATYVTDIGKPAPMPIWAYGPWMSGNEWDSDRRVREVVDRTQAEDTPATVLVIEAWSDESTFYLFNDTD
ncbi:MAG: glycoside hydrolase family 31 protein, partial [Chloroflexota bacterium]|nr:glycoside hydrolase family 31 protein [Chloroflexota bacterium]